MGLFNYVVFKYKCPECGSTVSAFQTKDDLNDELYLLNVSPSSVRNFYAGCPKCKHSIEFTMVPPEDPMWTLFHGSAKESESTYQTIGPKLLDEFGT